jgi:hypothetical protein
LDERKKTPRKNMKTLDELINSSGIKHFKASEVLLPGRGFPSEKQWPNIIGALRLADDLRERWGSAVKVVSGYRSPEYNAKVGGSKKSMHMEFRALDLQPANGKIEAFQKLTEEVIAEHRKRGTNVGFGLYDSFIHVDTGAPTGTNRTWDERSAAKKQKK